MDVRNKIKQIRLQSLLSQQDFAKQINVSFCTVNRWENGKAIPNYKALSNIKDFCKKRGIAFDVDIIHVEESK
ncbi:helix-turn-helix domain-containing protein [Gardnerella vaginalis]|uniref:DNA-binding helix-turn-helix protein n=1 Tax=Gardnerella vaginalis (strain ATCC 14019 / 317) TaxID=525284 RepID=E3D819_GARV3|nr:helix-turn-helix transcriptional regulator [Gardnerella vaginalis]ADP39396.1 DNA-binding helix-turn-helix protein [Gardnerella vaginalis ATCC 14019]KOS09436.1 hypothetical protein AM507_01255 [Gardnerella vaginalis]PMC50091.1 XRE family transcriptional regulator [Gardnerella vaginalis]RFT40514.1 XRE family transcriptional regulator [Gardnerella vaginalis]TCH80593.1 XRE family transcriptional regulator [Gardnerella vaginalis]